jgi:hypothetical protein
MGAELLGSIAVFSMRPQVTHDFLRLDWSMRCRSVLKVSLLDWHLDFQVVCLPITKGRIQSRKRSVFFSNISYTNCA